jgi:hypothetical protein
MAKESTYKVIGLAGKQYGVLASFGFNPFRVNLQVIELCGQPSVAILPVPE